jgi:deoxyadenosine/deoxycytidine kinase
MSPKLIIIRGNSGSGKSSIARIVRDELGENTMLVPQDIVRREILHVKDRLDNPAIELIQKIVLYGKEIGYNVVIEGILSKKLYGDMLDELIIEFGDDTHIFYMDVSFEETLKRHNTKPNKDEYGAEKMKEWWLEKDYLSIESEKVIPEIFSINDSTDFILKSLR